MIGFSLSPGGLLLPYHLGVLAALSYHGHLTPETHLAGSSAGAIAVASHAANVAPHVALEASMRISAQCNPFFLARGGLMPSLQQELNELLPTNAEHIVNERPGIVGMAHLELFPKRQPILATQSFESREALIDAVCASSMFPYFTSNKPFHVVGRPGSPLARVVVDGVFTEPLWRFGCPNLLKTRCGDDEGGRRGAHNLDRTVCISVFPKELVGLGWTNNGGGRISSTGRLNNDRGVISPPLQVNNMLGQTSRLGLLMCTPGSRKDLKRVYEDGWKDGERWVKDEEATTFHK
mmetsp:Transcript_7557/g.14315  ORF Transcript_7557/g.14315 Transcript_7557/m.14315 type:complete len:293 (+) Transcript_7557:91-969(+)